jgi:predicted  nucleic acid-binding Zn-ribbon protein
MATPDESEAELTTWVCINCGKELYTRDSSAGRMMCPRCGGSVFRPFDSPSPHDEVARDFLESTARHLDLGDADPDTRRTDVRDLDGR